jgi:quinolinate synthase
MNTNIEIIDDILKLKSAKDAVILAHNYQISEVQDIADYVGDSLQLSIIASRTKKSIIVFCGVYFMAETAKIINPEKKVLIPDNNAGCPMADMINARQLAKLKEKHPQALVVCYVNSTAEVKALSDICCTSANAVKVVNSIPKNKEIIFIPDKYLGKYGQSITGRAMIFWEGYCPTHIRINTGQIINIKKEHPGAKVVVHPENTPEVIELADRVESTGGMLKYIKKSRKKEFIIGTEIGIIHRLKKENPGKTFYQVTDQAICPNMKLINLEKILWSLEDEIFEVKIPPATAEKARKAIDRMVSIT